MYKGLGFRVWALLGIMHPKGASTQILWAEVPWKPYYWGTWTLRDNTVLSTLDKSPRESLSPLAAASLATLYLPGLLFERGLRSYYLLQLLPLQPLLVTTMITIIALSCGDLWQRPNPGLEHLLHLERKALFAGADLVDRLTGYWAAVKTVKCRYEKHN